MALKRCLLPIIVITVSIGISPIFTWSPDVRRYESYDLEKGPVFYEAYYPDDEPRTHYQEKRYFDREPVFEKTYQLSSEHAEKNYQDRPDAALQNVDRFSPQPLDIKEISKLARRAISRDLENWNTLEEYLDRAKYEDPLYPTRVDANSRDPYEEKREEPLPRRLRSSRDQRFIESDIGRNRFEAVPYENHEQQMIQAVRTSPVNTLNKPVPPNSLNSYPTENIFAPRPQVINYIFSKRPTENKEELVASETKETKESMPRNYGDNLIRDEMKEKEENKNAKIASIEVSEVPRHKTRHHHGDWPKREYPHRHQS
ncbi:uncharacterized protein LOC108624616 [Ceratina calcarata]|uniref:Uncharacterized protein LOC108624616 n=1 Tax=Ceratina calcarata TaxID=156304 RepID=A0AAJ7IXL8_9HYME|nr:uncharacterized protein LOC108624616 [Ceratina calcarata]